jgi:hypothetical protein
LRKNKELAPLTRRFPASKGSNGQSFASARTSRSSIIAGTISVLSRCLHDERFDKEKSMKKYLLALAASAAITTPAFADYYIIRGPDEKCEVVETVPENTVRVGPLAFTTRDEAERQVEVVCTEDRVVVESGDDDDNDGVVVERQ